MLSCSYPPTCSVYKTRLTQEPNSRILRLPRLDQKNEWVLVLVYHLAVVAGVALTAAGSANLQHPSAEHPVEKSLKMVKAGIAILAVSWGALVAWAGATFTTRGNTNENASAARAGSMVRGNPSSAISISPYYSHLTAPLAPFKGRK